MADKSKNIGCLGFFLSFLKKEQNETKEFNFEKKERLLSDAENSFHLILNQIFPTEYKIESKVRMADFIKVTGPKRMSGFGMIKSKHIDFLITESKTSKVLLGIELDDSTHNNESTKKRDEVKNEAMKEAGVPLLRIKASKTYNLEKLKEQVQEAWQ